MKQQRIWMTSPSPAWTSTPAWCRHSYSSRGVATGRFNAKRDENGGPTIDGRHTDFARESATGGSTNSYDSGGESCCSANFELSGSCINEQLFKLIPNFVNFIKIMSDSGFFCSCWKRITSNKNSNIFDAYYFSIGYRGFFLFLAQFILVGIPWAPMPS